MQLTTTSTEWVSIDSDLTVTLETTGNIISYELVGKLDKIGYKQTVVEFTVAVNGELMMSKCWPAIVSSIIPTRYWIPLELPAGKYTIQPYWRIRSGTGVSMENPYILAREGLSL